MPILIRNIDLSKDFDTVVSWHQPAPLQSMLPEESTFVAESNGKLLASITMYLTNTIKFAQLDNLVADPSIPKTLRHKAVEELVSHCESHARSLGYQGLFCFTYRPGLVKRYQELGYTKTLEQVTTFFKELT